MWVEDLRNTCTRYRWVTASEGKVQHFSQSQHRCHREGKLTHSTRAVCAAQTCGSRSTQRPVFLVFVVQTSGTFSKCRSAETVQPENLLHCLFVSLHFLLHPPPHTHTHIPSLNPCVLRKTEHSWHHQVKDVEQFVSCLIFNFCLCPEKGRVNSRCCSLK